MKGIVKIFNRAAQALTMRFHVVTANLWRDSYNPLRGLTITRAVRHLEDGERGAYSELQWLYRYIEMQDATLGALIELRTSAVQEMGWDIKIPKGLDEADQKLAEKQAELLRETYNNISNLKAAIEFLCLASFRGFAHLEVIKEEGIISELSIVDQWFWVRKGLNGDWQYNKDSKFGATKGEEIGDRQFVIREVQRPINRVALISFIRKSMSQKDWDGFIETYGIPAVFIIAPSDVPPDKEGEYQQVADDIASDARGVLPGGSDVKTVDNGARGVNPFRDHIQHQDEQVVLRGTGGKLTMLAVSGSGTLAGNAHADTFEKIARSEAGEISEILSADIDEPVLEDRFPGQKQLAYFEIASGDETDTTAIVRELAILARAGYKVDLDQVKERTGYEVTSVEGFHSSRLDGAPSPAAEERSDYAKLKNREADMKYLERMFQIEYLMNRSNNTDEKRFEKSALGMLDDARSDDLQELGDDLAALMHEKDFDTLKDRLIELDGTLPERLGSEASADAWEDIFTSSLMNGFADLELGTRIQNSGNSKGAKKGWETRRKNGWKPKRQREELAQFFDQAMGSSKELFLDYAEVSPAEAAKILSLTGLDVSGFKHTLDSSAVKHVIKSHGDETKENPRGQVAVSRADFEHLADYIRGADYVEAGDKTGQGLDTIRYYRDLNGTTYIIEEIRKGREKLVPKTIRKYQQEGWREPKKK